MAKKRKKSNPYRGYDVFAGKRPYVAPRLARTSYLSATFSGYNAVAGKPYWNAGFKVFTPYQPVHVPSVVINPSGRGHPLGRNNGKGFGRGSLTPNNKRLGMPSGGRATPKREDVSVARRKEPEPVKSSKTREWLAGCKKRPDSKRARGGSGGSREFVPWC